MDQAHVAGGAGGADGIGGAGDAQVERGLARGIVGDRAGVVVVGPELGVVVKFGDVVDLVLRLDVAVLRDAEVDAHPVLGHGLPCNATVGQRLAAAVDRDAAGAGADPDLLFLLMAQGVEVADAGELRPHVTYLHAPDARDPGE